MRLVVKKPNGQTKVQSTLNLKKYDSIYSSDKHSDSRNVTKIGLALYHQSHVPSARRFESISKDKSNI